MRCGDSKILLDHIITLWVYKYYSIGGAVGGWGVGGGGWGVGGGAMTVIIMYSYNSRIQWCGDKIRLQWGF